MLLSPPFLFVTHAQKNVNITSMAYNGKNVRWEDQEIVQTALKRLKGARHEILIHSTVYLRDRYMNEQELSETRFSRICPISFPFLWPRCTL